MKKFYCGICKTPHSSVSSASECNSSCTAIEKQYMDYYGTLKELNEASVKQPTFVVIEMPNNVTVKIACVD